MLLMEGDRELFSMQGFNARAGVRIRHRVRLSGVACPSKTAAARSILKPRSLPPTSGPPDQPYLPSGHLGLRRYSLASGSCHLMS